jgi:hypothetical protein
MSPGSWGIDMADLVAALQSVLLADAGIASATGGRVFGGELPEAEAEHMPRAAIVLRASGGSSLTSGSFVPHDTQSIDLLAYGDTPLRADELARRCRLVFIGLRRRVAAGCLIHWIDSAGGLSARRDRDGFWPYALQSFQIFHALEEVS